MSYARHFSVTDDNDNINDEGYAHRLAGHDDDAGVSSITAVQLRSGRFGGPFLRRQFGRGQSTLLTGAGMLTTNSDDDIRESNSQHFVSHERDLSVDGF